MCKDHLGKRVKVETANGATFGTLKKVECPILILEDASGNEVKVDCVGVRVTEVPFTPDAFWQDITK